MEYTCAASKKGTLIDYVVIAQGFRSLIGSCEVVREAPCGTHLGVRTPLVPNPADIEVLTLSMVVGAAPRTLKPYNLGRIPVRMILLVAVPLVHLPALIM